MKNRTQSLKLSVVQLVEMEARGEAGEPEKAMSLKEPKRAMSLKASSTTHKVGIHPKGSGRVFIGEEARLVSSLTLGQLIDRTGSLGLVSL